MQVQQSNIDAEAILKEYGFRRTTARVELLEALARESVPVRVEALQTTLPNMDPVTLYRGLEALTLAGILERSDFQHGHAHYELVYGRPHHHHAICVDCGTITDVPAANTETLNDDALRHTTGFSSITHHSLEFFGQCLQCA